METEPEIIEEPSIEDPNCLAKNPQVVTFSDVTTAAFKIKNKVYCTPCNRSHLSDLTGINVYLKKDFLQITGNFKERGACYALQMLPDVKKMLGVISASAGNHALALSYHGQQLNIPVTVVMPILAPIMKIQSCKRYGANVVVKGADMGEAKQIGLQIAQQEGLTYINGYDHPHIIAGQGTIGLEIVEQVPNIDAVVVPAGGGGLLAGVAVAIKNLCPKAKVIGVESDRCPNFTKAMKAGKPVRVPVQSTLADGLAVPKAGYNAFATASPLIDKMIVINEEWIALAILRLVELEKCVVEGSAAIGLAAILAGEMDEFKGKNVVLVLSGGNIDTTILGRCLDRGLAADGRLLKFSIVVSDRPGGIAELCKLCAELGVSIKDIFHERAWLTSDVFSVKIKFVCETRDMEHTKQLKEALFLNYKKVNFSEEFKLNRSRGKSSEDFKILG